LGRLNQGDRQVVEDPASLAFLAKLPGSPGPWTIKIEEAPEVVADPVGDSLKNLFGGTEEVS